MTSEDISPCGRPVSGRMRQRFAPSLIWFVASWFLPSAAFAEPLDPAAARVLFQEARKAVAENDYATACPKFADSYKLDPAVGTLLNIADCERRDGRIATAWVNFQMALDKLPETDPRRAGVAEMAAQLEKRLPKLSITLKPQSPADCTVERDGVALGASSYGIALPIDPGPHVVLVKAAGRADGRYEVVGVEGQTLQIQGEPGEALQAPVPPTAAAVPAPAPVQQPAPIGEPIAAQPPVAPTAPGDQTSPSVQIQPSVMHPQPRQERSNASAYVVGGLGVAGLALGSTTRVVAFGKQSTIDKHCPANECDPTGWRAVDSAKTLQTVSTVSLLAGAAALGVGIVLAVSQDGAVEQPVATMIPVTLQGGGGLLVTRHF